MHGKVIFLQNYRIYRLVGGKGRGRRPPHPLRREENGRGGRATAGTPLRQQRESGGEGGEEAGEAGVGGGEGFAGGVHAAVAEGEVGGQASAGEDQGAGGGGDRLGKLVGGEEHGAGGGGGRDPVAEDLRGGPVEAGMGLVEEHEKGVGQQAVGKADAALVAEGKGADEGGGVVLEAALLEGDADLGAGANGVESFDGGAELEEGADGHLGGERRAFGKVGDVAAHVEGVGEGVAGGDGEGAVGGRDDARQDAEERGLAAAVGTEEGDGLAGVEVEGEVGKGLAASEAAGEVAGFDEGGGMGGNRGGHGESRRLGSGEG